MQPPTDHISTLEFLIDPVNGGSAAGAHVRSVQQIPWLYRYPDQQLLEWRMKIKSVAEYYSAQSERALRELQQIEILPATKDRLKRLREAFGKSHAEFSAYIHELNFDTVTTAADVAPKILGETGSPPPTSNDHKHQTLFFEKTPRQQTVMAYQDTLFRDWVWGQDEIRQQGDLLLPYLKNSQSWAVLGAGACGLPLYLHQNIKPRSTLALDINPVLFLPVQKLLAGESFKCIEYPRIPKSAADVAIEHVISPPQFKTENFHLVFGDAQNIEFKKDHLDTVITPWFIDIIPRAFSDLARHINQNLPICGRWLNIGQMAFEKNELAQKLTPEEIRETLQASGYKIETLKIVELPYLRSPYSTMSRVDQILIFSAIKEKHAKKPARHEYLPEWLRALDTPVPPSLEIQNLTAKCEIFGRALRYVDGKRSLDEIAQAFAHDYKMDLNSARESLHVFFMHIHEQLIFREF